MTNNRADFHERNSNSDIPVIEGRMVQQFRFGAKAYMFGSGRSAKWIPNAGTIKAQFFMSRESLNDQLLNRIDTLRAGYCDIAGQTNERAMMTAIIPPGVVCGNKVPTIVFPRDDGEKQLYFFIGVTNSFTFDWILRRVLSTTVNYHVAVKALEAINKKIVVGRGAEYQLGQGVFLSTSLSGNTLNDALKFVTDAWAMIYAHIEELFFGEPIAMAYVLNADRDNSPYSLQEVTFAGETKLVHCCCRMRNRAMRYAGSTCKHIVKIGPTALGSDFVIWRH